MPLAPSAPAAGRPSDTTRPARTSSAGRRIASALNVDAVPLAAERPAPAAPPASRFSDDDAAPVKRTKRRSTSHLKAVPATLAERTALRDAAFRFTDTLDCSRPFAKRELEAHGRTLLDREGLEEKYLGFALVMIGNAFWRRQFLATPFERRLLLLPHCLKHAEGCPADYDEFGLDCEKCGACSIADYKGTAEKLGYKVLVAEGSPIVLKIIVGGYVDGILGVACLNVLEKAIDKVLVAGVPSYAVPLHSGDCKNTTLDESWIWEVLDKYEPLDVPRTDSYVPLMRAADELFNGDTFDRLVPRMRTADDRLKNGPLAATETIARDFLAHGGKRFRPFITLAARDAAAGGTATRTASGDSVEVDDAVARAAVAIEAFHKASLVHDDIEDGDAFRYGRETVHRRHGVGPAINAGDYLIGLGYRLLAGLAGDIAPEVAAEVTAAMADAHLKLCDGQGAEMAWQAAPDLSLEPMDALQIYALKTSPAFEAALWAGLRMGGADASLREPVARFTRQVGVGFQILNDLADWRGDDANKLVAGQDALALRPTVLLALAMARASDEERADVRRWVDGDDPPAITLGRLRRLFERHGAFTAAETLVERCRERALGVADEMGTGAVANLLRFLCDAILADDEPVPVRTGTLVGLPIIEAPANAPVGRG